jgi:hypothetical protein
MSSMIMPNVENLDKIKEDSAESLIESHQSSTFNSNVKLMRKLTNHKVSDSLNIKHFNDISDR